MQTLIEQTKTIIDIIRSEPQIPDELQESKTRIGLSLPDFEANCREALQREEQPFNEQQELLKLASLLYNECRMWLKKKKDAEPIVHIRFCSCILLQISCFQAASSADLPLVLLSSAPDIIRAYQHTARSMQDYSLGDLPFQCYQNAIALIDKITPRPDANVVKMYILLSQRKAEEQVCFEILVRVKDDCLRYLPDLKISFASQT